MKILLIEDDPEIGSYLQKSLQQEGYPTTHCREGEEGLDMLAYTTFDLILLDIMLPDQDGFSIIQQLRDRKNTIPIIVISALTEVDYRIKGLNIGADDYLSKPFEVQELIARIRVLLRRRANQATNTLQYKDLSLDLETHKVFRQNVEIELRAKEYQLLELLLRHQGKVLSRVTILESIWDMNYDGDSNTVDVHIRYLRKKVDLPFKTGYIKTIKGFGYVLK